MNWKPIYKNGVPDPYCKQSVCGRFRIAKITYAFGPGATETKFELFKKGNNKYEADGFEFIDSFKTSAEAEKASENI